MDVTQSPKTSQKQQTAIALLIEGKNDNQVAEVVGVRRETVNRWRREDDDFIEELDAQRIQIWGDALNALKVSVASAVDALVSGLDDPDPRVRVISAKEILKASGVYDYNKKNSQLNDPTEGIGLMELAKHIYLAEEAEKAEAK